MMNKSTESCADMRSVSPLLFLPFSGMFFDGNHTYMIEPGGQGDSSVSTLQIHMCSFKELHMAHGNLSSLSLFKCSHYEVVHGQIICHRGAVLSVASC